MEIFCKEWADKNKRSPTNVLLCRSKSHTKPSNQNLLNGLKKHLEGFKPANLQGNIILAAHFQIVAHSHSGNCQSCGPEVCKCHCTSKTRKPSKNQKPSVFNTETGQTVKASPEKIIEESPNDSFYVMQTLKMGKHEVLTFYDRGANQDLIIGRLAENLKLKVVSIFW